jgi:SAM-dependent methyltransferase
VDDNVSESMQADWNRRAREDANYYVAFGRRNQDDEEFFATARDQVIGLKAELRRLPPAAPRARRALEIGCGPGRLMRPMSRFFGEIHGVDVSDEMVRLAREKLAGVPHAHPHHAPNSNLEAFADDSFDFIYSYAVFQHIPSRDVVFGYLEEARRVLKPGGILKCQINGLPQTAKQYDTWAGVRVSADEIAEFARERQLMLLALEGAQTQYMWVTLRKPPPPLTGSGEPRIRRITNAHSSEPVAPVGGRFAALSLWVEGLPGDLDLNRLEVSVGGKPAVATYIGHPEHDGMQQINVMLPGGLATGLASVELSGHGRALAPSARVRLMEVPPPVPRLVSLTDGIDLMSGTRIVTGSIKVTLEEVEPGAVRAVLESGDVTAQLEDRDEFCADPRVPRWEVNFRFPHEVKNGPGVVRLAMGTRELGAVAVEIANARSEP